MNAFGADHLPAFVCSHVFARERPILLVSHEDGDWQFLCGGGHEQSEKPRVIGIGHIVANDPSLEQLADLGVNEGAERESLAHPWIRRA